VPALVADRGEEQGARAPGDRLGPTDVSIGIAP
jgi:hypothetical protein